MSNQLVSDQSLTGVFGSQSAYKVLLFLENYEKGYASEIARTFDISLSQAQNQLRKFEDAGLLVSRNEGASRTYYFKPSPITDSLRTFLRSILDSQPRDSLEKYFRQRRRPRRYGKR